MRDPFIQQITYRIEFDHYGYHYYQPTVYYSLKRALYWLNYHRVKSGSGYVLRLYAFKGDDRLQEITEETINALYN